MAQYHDIYCEQKGDRLYKSINLTCVLNRNGKCPANKNQQLLSTPSRQLYFVKKKVFEYFIDCLLLLISY